MAAAAAPIPANSAIYQSGEFSSPDQILDRLYEHYLTPDRVALITDPTGLLPPLSKMVAIYVLENLPVAIFGWHTAFTKLYTLEERQTIKLPALPSNIVQTLLGPITDEEAKAFRVAKGTLVSQVYSLRLVHQGSLNEYEERLAKYNAEHPDAKAIEFEYFWPDAKTEHGNTRYEWGWALISNDILPLSIVKTFEAQRAMLPDNCELATLPIACTSRFDQALTTEERLSKRIYDTNRWVSTYTRVLETTQKFHLTVENSSPGRLFVSSELLGYDFIGIVALRKFFF